MYALVVLPRRSVRAAIYHIPSYSTRYGTSIAQQHDIDVATTAAFSFFFFAF